MMSSTFRLIVLQGFLRLLLATVPVEAFGQSEAKIDIANGGFETYSPSRSPGVWQVNANGYTVFVDDSVSKSGRVSLKVSATENHSNKQGASIVQLFRPVIQRNHTLELSGHVRTAMIEMGQASLWAMVRKEDETTFMSTMESSGLSGSNDWTELRLSIPVAEGSDIVIFGLLHSGAGSAWFDDIELSVSSVSESSDAQIPVITGNDAANRKAVICSDNVPSGQISSNITGRQNTYQSVLDDAMSSPSLPNATLVSLGEFSHGASEVNALNLNFVKELHRRHGHNVVAIESSFVSCPAISENSSSSLSAYDLLHRCSGPQKQTRTYYELMKFVLSSWETDNPITIVGIDNAVLGDETQVAFENAMRTITSAAPNLAKALLAEKLMEPRYPSTEIARSVRAVAYHNRIELLVKNAIDTFTEHCIENRTSRCHSPTEFDSGVSLLKLMNLLSHVRQTALGIVSSDAKVLRDQTMAANMVYVLERLLPNSKATLLAHNAHVRNRNFEVLEFNREELQSGMGSRLHQWFGSKYVVFGTMAISGATREPVFGVMSVAETTWSPPWSQPGNGNARFVDFSNPESVSDEERHFSNMEISYFESGSSKVSFVPRSQYNGMFVFEEVSPSILCN